MNFTSAHTNNQRPGFLARIETLSILYVSVFLTRIGFGTILIIFPLYLGVSHAVYGVLLALYPAVEGISALPVGAYVDRRGRRRAFVLGMGLITLFTFVIGLTNDVALVGGAHALMGLSAALVTVSSLTMITDLTVKEDRGAGMGAFDMANLAGYGTGIIFGIVAVTAFQTSLGTVFLIVAGIFAVATVFSFLFLREPRHLSLEKRSLAEMFGSLTGDVGAILPAWFSLTIITGFYTFLPNFIGDTELLLSRSAVLITIGLVVLGLGAVLFGHLSDKIGRTKTMMIGAAGEIGFLLVFPDLFQRLVELPQGLTITDTFTRLGFSLFAASALFFLGSALVPSILAYIGDRAARESRGSAMGLYSLLLSAGIATGNVLAGFAADFGGVQAVFYLAVTIFSSLCLTTGVLLRRGNHLASRARDLAKAESKPL